MKFTRCFFLLFILIFFNLHCSNQSTGGGTPPDMVQWQPKSDETAPLESGIDAMPDGDAIRLEWIRSGDDVVGYELYRSQQRGANFNIIARPAGDDHSYIDFAINTLTRYYYYIVAVNSDDIPSDPSDTLSYMLLEKAINLQPQGALQNRVPRFQWVDINNPPAAQYILRLMDQSTDENIWISEIDREYGNEWQEVQFNNNTLADYDSLLRGHPYQWRIDVVGGEVNSGSESVWRELTIQ